MPSRIMRGRSRPRLLPFISSCLAVFYVIVPLCAVLLAIFLSRRHRSHVPLVAVGVTAISALLIGGTYSFFFMRITASTLPLTQAGLVCYIVFGVLSLLKGLNWVLRHAAARLLRIQPSQSPTRRPSVGWSVRAAIAFFVRAAILFTLGLPYFMALALVYRPKVAGGDNPKVQLDAAFDNIAFESTDGVRLAGWWIPTRAPVNNRLATPDWGQKTVILCHGLGAGKSNQLALVRDLVTHGYNIVAFDFRAHGESGGQASSFGDRERYDVLGAVRWIRAAYPNESRRIYGLGVNMGAAALIAAAGEASDEGRAIDAVAVFSTFDDLDRLADDMSRHWLIPPMGWLARNIGVPVASLHAGADLAHFSPADRVDWLSPRPLLVVHGRGDEIIPFEAGVRLFERASQPKLRFWIGEKNREGSWVIRSNKQRIPDEAGALVLPPAEGSPADHNNIIFDDDAVKAVRLFFEHAHSAV